jgi:sialic acid synthase SpsE
LGPGQRCYIMGEAGSNHDRNLSTALALVDAAAAAGCDAVKFQTFSGEDIASGYQAPETAVGDEFARWGRSLLELYRSCALPDTFHEHIAARAAEKGIAFISSAFSERAVERLVTLGVPAIKIASFELVHLPLIRFAASTGLPLIISTGMAGLGDVERGLDAVARGGGRQVVLLHCASNYPLGAASANLAAMETIRRAFGIPVGYSDHTLGVTVPIAAAAVGAAALEKHFTLGRSGDGPDHSFAIEPDELKTMVGQMRIAEAAVGTSRKTRVSEEALHARRGRRSLFAARYLKSGTRLTLDAVKIVRPGIGLEPMLVELLIGRPVIRDVPSDSPLTWDDFLGPQES